MLDPDHDDYTVSAGGERFLFEVATEDERPPTHVVAPGVKR
jgi:hypothetical protein